MHTDRTKELSALGQALRERRARLKLSQEEVALDSGLARKTMYELEHGLTAARLSTLLAVVGDLAALEIVFRRAADIAARSDHS
jgi:transcriptional regulator with XRE-family HTH domain